MVVRADASPLEPICATSCALSTAPTTAALQVSEGSVGDSGAKKEEEASCGGDDCSARTEAGWMHHALLLMYSV